MPRIDVHRPSAIEPTDYQFVAFDCLPAEGDIIGNAMFLAAERARKRAHMKRTGGHYSQHEHGGNCHICGSVNAIYTATFYHPKSNGYIRTGLDCADKLECEGVEAFRRNVKDALEAGKGKRKAKAVLEKLGIAAAWSVYTADVAKRAAYAEACSDWRDAGEVEADAPKWVDPSRDETTVIDIVERLIKWGDISDKAANYLKVLVDRIERAPQIAAERAAEAASALPVPVVEGRTMVRGTVLTIRKPREDDFYPVTKMLVQHADGWKVWGAVPAAIKAFVAKGDAIEFNAAVKVSDNDPKFGFFSRPAKAKVIKALAA